jgi:DNA-binding NarL/FixJ family response regulator
MSIGILFVDDHEVFHDCIRHLFNTREDMRILAVANNGQTALRLTRELLPDVVVMDVRLPTLNGIEATRQILQIHPRSRVVGLSGCADRQTVVEMLRAGARGYVVKDAAFTELIQAIETVMTGRRYLSPALTSVVVDAVLGIGNEEDLQTESVLTFRERQVLQMVAEGMTSRQIADSLCVSPKTVETHRTRLMKKLNLTSLADLVKHAIREGLTSL